jgi:hypothetical protein
MKNKINILSNVKTKYQDMKTARLFKKHNVSTWAEYNLKFDCDYDKRADTIRTMFHGYPFIAEINDSRSLLTNAGDNWEDGYDYLRKWLATKCKCKARSTIARTIRTEHLFSDGTKHIDWDLNTFGGDSAFIAFQDERDYLIFLLKWETA